MINYIFNQFVLQECGDFTWRVSDCEELVGGYSQEMMGLVLEGYSEKVTPQSLFGESDVGEVTFAKDDPLSIDLTIFPVLSYK